MILSFFVGSDAPVALAVVRYALVVLLEVGLAEHAMRVAVEVLRILVLQHALLLLGDVVFDIAATGDAGSDYGVGSGHALEVRHVVILVFLLLIISLLFYLLVHALSDLLGRPLHHHWISIFICISSLCRSQQLPILLLDLPLPLL